jgi:hypothetical protein
VSEGVKDEDKRVKDKDKDRVGSCHPETKMLPCKKMERVGVWQRDHRGVKNKERDSVRERLCVCMS